MNTAFDEELFDLARNDDYEGIHRVIEQRKAIRKPRRWTVEARWMWRQFGFGLFGGKDEYLFAYFVFQFTFINIIVSRPNE